VTTTLPAENAPAGKSPLPRYTVITASVVVGVYLALTGLMLWVFGFDPRPGPNWDHAILIYNSFLGFAFAAGGVLLGTQIQQVNVDAARREAGEAKSETAKVKQAVKNAVTEAGDDRGGANAPDPAARLARVRNALLQAF
jgi:hypothetical protein